MSRGEDNRGVDTKDRKQQKEISSKGGKASHKGSEQMNREKIGAGRGGGEQQCNESGQFTSETGRGRKGGRK